VQCRGKSIKFIYEKQHKKVFSQIVFTSDILAFVEPHLLTNDDVDVPGYHCFHRSNCRRGRNSEGGLALAKEGVHVNYNFQTGNDTLQNSSTIVTDFSSNGHCLIINFQIQSVKVFVVYKSPHYSNSAFMQKLEVALRLADNNRVVLGDFNIDLQKPEGGNVLQIFSSLGMEAKIHLHNSSTDGGTHIDCCFSDIQAVDAWFYETYYSYHKAICVIWPTC
jgi:hypothetical protein